MFMFLRRKQLEHFFFGLLVVLLGVSVIASAEVFPYLEQYKSHDPSARSLDSVCRKTRRFIFFRAPC
jgi:hypothetical protein